MASPEGYTIWSDPTPRHGIVPAMQAVPYTIGDMELHDAHMKSIAGPARVPHPQLRYGGQQVLYHPANYVSQQPVVYQNALPTAVPQEPLVSQVPWVHVGSYPQVMTPLVVMNNGATTAQREALAYQPLHDQAVGYFLHQTTRRLWHATERLRRWCVWEALHVWKIHTSEDKIQCLARKRLRDLGIALRKAHKDQQQVDHSLRKKWSHTKVALENSNASELDRAIADEDFRRRLRHVAFEFGSRTDEYEAQVAEARQELRIHRGCLVLQFILVLLKRRQLLACTLHWRDVVVLGCDPGMLPLMHLFRDPQGCRARRWRMLGLPEEELHAEGQRAAASRGPTSRRLRSSYISGPGRAGILLLRSVLEGQRHRMCAWALERLLIEAGTQDDDMLHVQNKTAVNRSGFDVSLVSESPLLEEHSSSINLSTGGWSPWEDPVPDDRGGGVFDFSTTPNRVPKIIRWSRASDAMPAVVEEPQLPPHQGWNRKSAPAMVDQTPQYRWNQYAARPAVVEQPLAPQYNPRVTFDRATESQAMLDIEDSLPSVPSDPEHDAPHAAGNGQIKRASAGPLDAARQLSDSSLDSADWIYTPVEVVSVDRLRNPVTTRDL